MIDPRETEQGSGAWFTAKLGKVSSSRIHAAIAPESSEMRATYMAELAAERLSGEITQHGDSYAMARGRELEEEAANAYEARHAFMFLERIGFVPHPTIPNAGASPDRLVGPKGLAEFKCLKSAIHIKTILNGYIKVDYKEQCLWQLACTGRDWCDYASYDPRWPAHLQLKVIRIERDEEWIADAEAKVIVFLEELDAMVRRLMEVA